MKNNLLNEEIQRFFEIVGYRGVIEESLATLAGRAGAKSIDDIIKQTLRDVIEKETKAYSADSLQKMIKNNVSLPKIATDPSVLKQTLTDPSKQAFLIADIQKQISKELNNPSYVIGPFDIITIKGKLVTAADTASRQYVMNTKQMLKTGARETAQTAAQTGAKGTAQTAAQTGARETAQTASKEASQVVSKQATDISGWKASLQQASDAQMLSRRIPKDEVLKGLNKGQKEAVENSASQIQKQAGPEVDDLVKVAETPQGLLPKARKKMVDFLERMKLVKVDPKTGKRKLSKIGWATTLVLGFGGVYLIGAMNENGVEVEGTDTTGESGTDTTGGSGETGGGSGVTGWRSLGKQYDDQIKTAMGLPTDERLSDADIDTLYNKLKENGKI
jgi:hypothetical protein